MTFKTKNSSFLSGRGLNSFQKNIKMDSKKTFIIGNIILGIITGAVTFNIFIRSKFTINFDNGIPEINVKIDNIE